MSQDAVVTFLQKLEDDPGMKKEFFETVPPKLENSGPIVTFAGQHGFEFSEDELKKVAESQRSVPGELNDEQLGAVVGGALAAPILAQGTIGGRLLQNIAIVRRGGSFNL